MRAAVKEVEDLERKTREAAGLPTVAADGEELSPIELSSYKDMKEKELETKRRDMDKEQSQMEQNVEELETKMKEIQNRLKELSRDIPEDQKENVVRNGGSQIKKRPRSDEERPPPAADPQVSSENPNGATGADGTVVDFPEYDGKEPPKEAKKAFTHFCISNRKEVKQALDPAERKDKEKVHGILRERWLDLQDDEKQTWRTWATWDKKRYERDLAIYESEQSNGGKGDVDDANADAEQRDSAGDEAFAHVPKKKKKRLS
jgi:hypothetical protein